MSGLSRRLSLMAPAPQPARRSSRGSFRGSSHAGKLSLFAVPGLPEITPRLNLAAEISGALKRSEKSLAAGDVVVVAQKIVSKCEGRVVALSKVRPSRRALRLAKLLRGDARAIQVILGETRSIIRKSRRTLIVETRQGFICANAGVDHSNVPGEDKVTLLPHDPDRSARRLAVALRRRTGKRVAVIISDTFGRPWRLGLTNVALGASGLRVLKDLRGQRDRDGKMLRATVLATADELAAAAGLLMQKAGGTPVVVIRGFAFERAEEPALRILRPKAEDLFR